MRTFVKFDEQGKIISTCRFEFLPEGLDHPYIDLADGEFVIEIEPTEGFEEVSCVDIHNNYTVDVDKRRLVPVTPGRETSQQQTGGQKPKKRKK